MHIIHQKTEYYWISKKHIDNLITSIWIADGKGLITLTNLLLPRDFDYSTYNQDMLESEPSTPTTPGFLLHSTVADIGRPFSLGYRMETEMGDVEECARWRTSDFEKLLSMSVHIPLDFYPLCK